MCIVGKNISIVKFDFQLFFFFFFFLYVKTKVLDLLLMHFKQDKILQYLKNKY